MELGKNLVSIKNILTIKSMLRTLVNNSGWFLIFYMLILSAGLSIVFAPTGDGTGWSSHFFVFIPYGFLFGLMSFDFILLLGFPIYGEFIQLFFPWKTFDLIDMSINIFGAYVGFFIAILIKRRILFAST